MKFTLRIILSILLFSLISLINADDFPVPPVSDFCKAVGGVQLNGSQVPDGFCSSQIMGQIPSTEHMTSTIILTPRSEAILEPNKDFTVTIKINHLVTGKFSDPKSQYYLSPQKLDDSGAILGHSHLVVQRIDSSDDGDAPDARNFTFFHGFDDPASEGKYVQTVPGLPTGRYRICTLSSSLSHQPVIMPVAKRGAPDDCIRITVNNDSPRSPKDKTVKRRSPRSPRDNTRKFRV